MSFSNALSITRDIAIGLATEMIDESHHAELLFAALGLLILMLLYRGKASKPTIHPEDEHHRPSGQKGQINVVLIACVALVLMMLVCLCALALGYYTIIELHTQQ